MFGNKNLNSAARAKKDEFYTQFSDIENELRHYKNFFADKIVLCNCNDMIDGNFFKYFAANFNNLRLKKLICTSYADSSVVGQDINFFPADKPACVAEVTALNTYTTRKLFGDENFCAGDFRSKELVELLKEADVVVTNPPFSLFREYVAQLIAYDKKFLIIGNMNAITYKEIFRLIMQNKIWLGYGFRGGDPQFKVPDDYESDTRFWIDDGGQRWRSFGNLHWFTNLDLLKRHEKILLCENYTPEKYPRYDNYDAIEVSRVDEIPADYFGVMGVPITFLDKYNPAQFEILGKIDTGKIDEYNLSNPVINGKNIYKRIAIRRR